MKCLNDDERLSHVQTSPILEQNSSKASAGFVAEVKRKPAADVQVVSSQGIPTDYK